MIIDFGASAGKTLLALALAALFAMPAVYGQTAGDSSNTAIAAKTEGLVLDIATLPSAHRPVPASSPAPTLLLKASIEHRDSLPPVDSSLQEGATFDESKLPKPEGGDRWYRIPDWFAGHWSTETMTCYYVRDLRTGSESRRAEVITARGQEDIGYQQDANGDIWEYSYQAYRTTTEGDTTNAISLVREHEPVEIEPDRVVYRYVSTQIYVDKTTRRILRVSQVESLQTYTSPSRDVMRCVSSLKAFDSRGRAVRLQRNVTAKLRTTPFHSVSYSDGKDMRESFRKFLIASGMANLIPGGQEELTATARALAPVTAPVRKSINAGGRK